MEIDIEKCYFITKYHDCRICNGKSLRIHCRDNNNCYFKQLQRLKAENEELKEKIIIAKEMLQFDIEQTNIYPLKNNLIKTLKMLEVENEIL